MEETEVKRMLAEMVDFDAISDKAFKNKLLEVSAKDVVQIMDAEEINLKILKEQGKGFR